MGRETATDAELIAACRRGETAAFGIIVERYQGKLPRNLATSI